MIGQVGITRENPDYYALMLGNAVLGGMSMSSILYDEVREKRGLVYTVSSGFDPLQYRGPFMIYLQTKSSTVDQANELIKKILKKFIDDGPTTKQLDAAKNNMIGGFPLSLSSNSAILAVVSNIAFYHRPLNYVDMYEKNMRAVTIDQVKKAFQKNIDVNKLVTIVVG
jgi:zinc protease